MPWLRAIRALLVVGVLLVVSACGGKVSTVLAVDDEGAGERVMTVAVVNDRPNDADFQKILAVPIDKWNASITKHLPQGLTFDGVVKQKDGGLSATFRLKFTSHDDYLAKVNGLIGANSVSDPESDIVNSNTPLIKGVRGKENFNSKMLLAWLPKALVEDGVIDSSAESYILNEDGDTVLSMGGKKYTSKSTSMSVDSVVDHGFDSVIVKLAVDSPTSASAVINYLSSSPWDGNVTKLVDNYLASVAPSPDTIKDADLSQDGFGRFSVGKSITLATMPIADLSKAIGKALGGVDPKLTVATKPDPKSPLAVGMTVSASVTCPTICAGADRGSTQQGQLDVTAPDSWKSVGSERSDDGSRVSAAYVATATVESVTADAQVAIQGQSRETLTFVVNRASSPLSADDVTAAFKPEDGQGEVQSSEVDGKQTVTVTFSGSVDQVNSQHNSYVSRFADGAFQSGPISVSKGEGDLFNDKYSVAYDPVLSAFALDAAPKVTLSLSDASPAKNQFVSSSDQVGAVLGGEASKFKVSGIITAAVIAVVVLGLVALAVIKRKSLSATFAKSRANAQAKAQQRAQTAAQGSAAQEGAQASTPQVTGQDPSVVSQPTQSPDGSRAGQQETSGNGMRAQAGGFSEDDLL